MTGITCDKSPPKYSREVLRPLQWGAAVAWTSWALSIALLWVEQRLWILHPWPFLFIIPVMVTCGAALITLVFGFWRVFRGPRRRAVFAWVVSAIFPLLLWTFLGLYAHRNGASRYDPHNLPMTLMTRVGHNLMEAQAVYLYPYRLETDRLVMFYDDSVTDPEGDIRAMDQHVARLEEMTGLQVRAKIYWARGRLLGQGPHCVYGIVNGSNQSPAGYVDEHELAHAVETQHDSPDRDHPTLLGEGWAESRSAGIKELAKRALAVRERLAGMGKSWGNLSDLERAEILSHLVEPHGQERLLWKVWEQGPAVLYLRELTDAFWYHRHSGPVYSIGGAFVDFLVRRQGGKRFIELYFGCRPGTFEADCQRIYGLDLDTLEKQFWEETEQLAADGPRPER